MGTDSAQLTAIPAQIPFAKDHWGDWTLVDCGPFLVLDSAVAEPNHEHPMFNEILLNLLLQRTLVMPERFSDLLYKLLRERGIGYRILQREIRFFRSEYSDPGHRETARVSWMDQCTPELDMLYRELGVHENVLQRFQAVTRQGHLAGLWIQEQLSGVLEVLYPGALGAWGSGLFISRSRQGQGWGTYLLSVVQHRLNLARLEVFARPELREFYLRNGFCELEPLIWWAVTG